MQVQSLVSCVHTRAAVHIEPNAESVPIATLIRVHLFAKDVDDLNISFTRAEMSLGFGDHTIPMQWTRGSNQYVADVPAELTAQPGRYDLVVRANDAWDEKGPAPTCELLRRTIIVSEGLSTTWILVGAAAAAVVVLGGLLVVVRKRQAHLRASMAMLFTEVCANPVPTRDTLHLLSVALAEYRSAADAAALRRRPQRRPKVADSARL